MRTKHPSSRVPAERRIRSALFLAPALALALVACGDPLAAPLDDEGPERLAPGQVQPSVLSFTGPTGIVLSLHDAGIPSAHVYARAVNRAGQFAGVASDLFATPRFNPYRAESDGTTTLLGRQPFPGNGQVTVLGLNDAGTVTGWGDTGSMNVAWTWTDQDGYTILPGPYRRASGSAINNAGVVAGHAMPPTTSTRPVYWDATGMHFLDYPGSGGYGYATAVSEDGRFAGQICQNGCEAYYWPDGGAPGQAVGTLGGNYSIAYGVNSSGVVAGYSITATNELHAFTWTPAGGMVDLGTLGGRISYAYHISEQGVVVGRSLDASNGWQPVLWTDATGIIPLPVPAGYGSTTAAYRVSGNWVAGYVNDGAARKNRAALWNIEGLAQNQAPTADAGPDQTIECDGPGCGEVFLDGSGSSDPDGDDLNYTWYDAAGNQLATGMTPDATCLDLGTHSITLVVSDGQEQASDEVVITVVDTTAPNLDVAISPESLWPPNHRYVEIGVSALADDLCDEAVAVTATVVSSEPDDERGNGDGRATADIRITHADGSVSTSSNGHPAVAFDPGMDRLEVRAERAGRAGVRSYTITVTATDASGNATIRTKAVAVSHDRRRR